MNKLTTFTLAALLAACGPCGGTENGPAEGSGSAGTETAEVDLVATAVELVTNLDANPQQTAVVLDAAGFTIGEFQDMMAEIASDPELSAAYVEATGE